MKSNCSTLALTAAALSIRSALSFAPTSSTHHHSTTTTTTTTTTSSSTALTAVINKDFGRAVTCAEHFGMCDVDELVSLADKLDDLEGCVYEDGKEMCDKEESDRRDIAETLRMSAELQLRMDYLKKANLFVEDVHKELEMEQVVSSWDEYKDKHGMGLGLW
mmetsp:Transcript_19539/g.29638  ORF Transcript_19539/g.29638 Transcript_19539/m.29638 type:complete len:162 (+) Transcript_19539:123-608(+)